IPTRANLALLKNIGIEVIIAFSAVCSLREEIKPKDFVLPIKLLYLPMITLSFHVLLKESYFGQEI
ncbi:18017_t:CDS:1, partial [Rhizophagus irregularis]